VPFVSNIPQQPAHRPSDIRMKLDQFEAKPRHVGVMADALSQHECRLGRDGSHNTNFATHSVIAITNRGHRRQQRPLNHATDDARA
jgi:hypothetical protein